MTMVATIYWWLVTEKWWLYTALADVGATMFVGVWTSYRVLESQLGSDSLTPLTLGAASFVIAIAISALKGGLMEAGFNVRLANPTAVDQWDQGIGRSDRSDVSRLSH